VPNGKRVKKGDFLAELDSAALRNRLVDQEITTKKAQTELMNAQKTKEVAEIILREYQEGTYPQELERLQGEVALAESALNLAEERLKMAHQDEPQKSAKQAELDRDRARTDLQKARKALVVLRDYSHPAALARLQADIETCRADGLMKHAVFSLEDTRRDRLVRQIAECKIVSLFAGKVIHSRIDGQEEVKEGTVLRERQEILRMIPDRDEEKP
jgi:multidrug efflux pump subunit AcrA (membrane-fusion protein)